MEHPTEDKLLEFELELLEVEEERGIREHIDQCRDCRMRFGKLRDENSIIGCLDPQIELPLYAFPKIKKYPVRSLLRFAAVLVIGFIIGFGTSLLSRPASINVIPQYIETKPKEAPLFQFTSTEVVDL